MHIDDLISDIRLHIPFSSESEARDYLSKFDEDDRIAFISALYFGRSHIHSNHVNDDFRDGLFSGEIDRFWEKDNVPDREIALVLYQKGSNLTTYYDAFQRCTTNSNYNRHNY